MIRSSSGTSVACLVLLSFQAQVAASLNSASLLMITLPLVGLYNLYALD